VSAARVKDISAKSIRFLDIKIVTKLSENY
jgi:hypothetical protein